MPGDPEPGPDSDTTPDPDPTPDNGGSADPSPLPGDSSHPDEYDYPDIDINLRFDDNGNLLGIDIRIEDPIELDFNVTGPDGDVIANVDVDIPPMNIELGGWDDIALPEAEAAPELEMAAEPAEASATPGESRWSGE